MSSGPADCAAEGAIYREVWNAVYDVRKLMNPKRWSRILVAHVNTLLDGTGWCFVPARYAELPRDFLLTDEQAVALWNAVSNLRDALESHQIGHRGWTPCIDPELDGLLRGTGCELVEAKKEC